MTKAGKENLRPRSRKEKEAKKNTDELPTRKKLACRSTKSMALTSFSYPAENDPPRKRIRLETNAKAPTPTGAARNIRSMTKLPRLPKSPRFVIDSIYPRLNQITSQAMKPAR